jgi:hypothetical protein
MYEIIDLTPSQTPQIYIFIYIFINGKYLIVQYLYRAAKVLTFVAYKSEFGLMLIKYIHKALHNNALLALLWLAKPFGCYCINNTLVPQNVSTGGEKQTTFFSYPGIKSVKISKAGGELTFPLIELNTDERVLLQFDDLEGEITSYSYSLVHCTHDWQESGLIANEYMDGFAINTINTYESSMATTVAYTHYQLELPNNDVRIKLSGNYVVRVFDTYNPDRVLIQAQFMVIEPVVAIDALVQQPVVADRRQTSQQLAIKISTASIRVNDPYTEIITVVSQNDQPDRTITGIKPVFVKPHEIDYTSAQGLIFDGVNEYRAIDIKSFGYLAPGLQNVTLKVDEYHVELKPDDSRRNWRYSSSPDINGKYLVKLERSERSQVEADYAWVYFTLPHYDELSGKEVYVYGELTAMQLTPAYRMQYNAHRQAFELRLQLKQGYYNYRYVVVDKATGETDHPFFEGNHFEAENTYQILVYLNRMGDRYNRLVGVKRVNSATK